MNVLYVSPAYAPHVGGVEYVVKSLASRLSKRGHQVAVLCGESRISKPQEEELEGVHIIRWPVISFKNAYHIPRCRKSLVELLKYLIKIYDIVHIHSAHAVFSVWVGLKIKQLNPDLKVIFTLHYHGGGHTWIRDLLWRLFWRNAVRKLIELSDKIHAVSNYEAQLVTRHYPEANGKIVVVPNGVDEDVFQYRWKGQNSDYIIYAGRIEKYKGLDLAVDLAKELGLNLLVIGEGPYKNKLTGYAKRRYPGRVIIVPPQPRQKYLELLANARYAVNLSQHEAYSIFIAEALAIGVPALVSEVIAKILSTEPVVITNGVYLVYKTIPPSWNTVIDMIVKDLYLC